MRLALSLILALSCAHILAAPIAKPAITHADYAGWRSIQGATLSRDGRWAAYALVGQESDGELVVRRLADGQEWRAPRGTAPAFSADGRYLAFAIRPTQAELDKAKKDKKKGDEAPKPGAGWMDLASGKFDSIDRVKRFAWGQEGGTQLALLLEGPPKKEAKKEGESKDEAEDRDDQEVTGPEGGPGAVAKKKEAGTELILIDAPTGERHSHKDVSEFAWARNGERLAFAVSILPAAKESKEAKPAETTSREGVYLIEAADLSQARALLSGAGDYRQLQFDRAGQQLAFVSNRDYVAEHPPKAGEKAAEKSDPTPYKLFLWRAGEGTATVLVKTGTPGLPTGWAPSEHAPLSFSRDGQRLFLGTALVPKPEPKDAPEPMKVDLWSWKDPELQSVQKVRAERERQRSYRAVVHLGVQPRFVQLASLDVPNVIVNDNARFALGISELPYRMLQSWDSLYHDAYVVDLQTGMSRLLASKLREAPTLSPAGRYVLTYEPAAKRWSAWRTEDGRKIELTRGIKTRFDNEEDDRPEPANAYGMAGWTEGDAAVVLYDRFDLWAISPESADGVSARNLSSGYGRKYQLQLRYLGLDPDEEGKALPSQPWILSATHDVKRSSGFYRMEAGGGEPKVLVYAEKMIGGLLKARQAEAMLFTKQSFTEFPDLWAAPAGALASAAKISAANPQQERLNWGTQELISYVSADGRKLRALLAKPENYEPGRKYPLMVYIYERMSDKLYNYVPPAPAQNINVTRYVSNGYLVLRPDITYGVGRPGRDALNAVSGAVQQLIRQGLVDPRHVGIQGHSWGAYQISYMITHTRMFAAAEAGASMADMVSGYGGIRWGTGVSRAVQYEQGQSRMGGPPWALRDKYIESSPIFFVDKVKTPFLTIHNDDDDAVPWYQAIEFFTALRRLGKEAYWFNFNGEKHGLKERDNMKYYTVHMAEFFDHYLQGAPRPEWMDKPVPYLQRGKRDVMPLFKPVSP